MTKKLHLHLDEDASQKSLFRALQERGYDVTRTPNEWMPLTASDEEQLLGAVAHDRAIFTYNVRDFLILAKLHPHHAGIILAVQKNMNLNETINALDRLLREAKADDWQGQVRWLADWRE